MKKYLIATAALVLFSIPSLGAAAPDRPGPYFTGFLGANFATDTTVTFIDNTAASDDDVTFDPGVYVGGTGGYDFGFVRLEGELSYRHADLDTVTFADGRRFRNVDGDLGAFTGMFNAFFDLHNPSRVTPYVGGGIGFASLFLSDTDGRDTSGINEPLYSESDDTVFAYQIGAGMDIAINNRYSLDIGYRYLKTDKAELESDFNFTTNELRYESHSAMVGFKFKF